ncbi:MAG: alpha/beta hydrolase [Bdellovibrionales bacterium]|nr:alpha/beta hydrolase [Bdellovibrionales bacterium]
MPKHTSGSVRVKNAFRLAFQRRPASGAALLLLHGLQSNSGLFGPFFCSTQFENFDLIAPDLLGFGASSKPADASYDIFQQVELISEFCESLEISRFHVIGHSLGGMIGTLLLEANTGAVLSLSSLEGNLTGADCGASRKVAELSFADFQGGYYSELKASLASCEEPSAALRRTALDSIPDHVFYETSKSIISWSESGKLLQAFSESEVPRCLIIGERSHYTARPEAEHLQTHTIRNAGHFMIQDNPEQTLGIVRSFLRSVTLEGPDA